MARSMRAFIFGHHACHAMHKLCIVLMLTLPGMKIESVRREVHEAPVREACVREAWVHDAGVREAWFVHVWREE